MGTPKKEIDKEYLFNLLMPTAASDLPEDAAGCAGAVGGSPDPRSGGCGAFGTGKRRQSPSGPGTDACKPQ